MSSKEAGLKRESATLDDLGQAKGIVPIKTTGPHCRGLGQVADIKAWVQQIRRQIEEPSSGYGREKLQELLTKLSTTHRN